MKYTVEIELDLPRDRVVALFDNADNLYKWMEGLESMEHLSGEPGQSGAKTKLVFKMGNRVIEMIETITARELPDRFDTTYEVDGVFNIVSTRFIATSPDKTMYASDQEFQFNSLLMKVFGLLMPGSFKKQSLKYLKDFKRFAESEGR